MFDRNSKSLRADCGIVVVKGNCERTFLRKMYGRALGSVQHNS